MSTQITNVRAEVMTAGGVGVSKSGIHESESGEGREVHPAGRTSGALEGWTVFPGVGAGVGVQMVVPTAPQQGCCSGASTSVRGPAGAGIKEEGRNVIIYGGVV